MLRSPMQFCPRSGSRSHLSDGVRTITDLDVRIDSLDEIGFAPRRRGERERPGRRSRIFNLILTSVSITCHGAAVRDVAEDTARDLSD